MENRNYCSGLATLEILVALLVVSPLLLGAGGLIHHAILTDITLRAALNDVNTSLRVESALQDTLNNLDSYTFDIPIRIHSNNVVLFTDGTPNPINQSLSATRPTQGSDAISSMRLDSLNSHIVNSAQRQGGIVNFVACQRYSSNPQVQIPAFISANYHSYLGVAPSGFYELTGNTTSHPGLPECRDFQLTSQKSMVVPTNPSQSFELVRLLVPIQDIYTLYIDTSNQLRFLSHSGAANIENQPITQNVRRLILSQIADPTTKTIFLTAHILTSGGRSFEFSRGNVLGRSQFFNLLLSRP